MDEKKTLLLGMTLGELKAVASEMGMPAFAAHQMAQWLYRHHVGSIDEMTNLSKTARERLAQAYAVGAAASVHCQRSADGTVKYLFPVRGEADGNTPEGRFVETVYIPEKRTGGQGENPGDRATLCVSCQVGCKMNCLFCQTGKQGFEGNLSVADILNQVYALPERDRLTNIVFMGQGEPMDNLDHVLRATEILTADYGYGWSPKRITVSSVGIRNKLKRFLDQSECHVAISMHSPLPEQRSQWMPAERQMSIADTVALLKQYDFTHQRRCSFEYICLGGLNDTPLHAREIARLLSGLECRVNLIRFHEIEGAVLPASDEARMVAMRDYLTAHGIYTTIRASRGQDILAACGLLSTAKRHETA